MSYYDEISPLPLQMPGEPFRAPGLIAPIHRQRAMTAMVRQARGTAAGGAAPLGYRSVPYAGNQTPAFSAGSAPSGAGSVAEALAGTFMPQRQWSGKFGQHVSTPSPMTSIFGAQGGAKANFAGDMMKPDPSSSMSWGSWLSGLFGGGGVKG